MSREAPTAKVELGGEVRTFRFDMGAVIDFDELTGINLLGLYDGVDIRDPAAVEARADEVEAQLRHPKTLCALLCALMRHENPDLEVRTVARWVHPAVANELMLATMQLMGDGVPEDEPEPPGATNAEGSEGPPVHPETP